jgi:ubiquinone/menaquinone biosynthesis C-methylase UbiE
METDEEAREYDSMDHSAVNLAFVQDLLAGGDVVGEVIDLGTGTAQIPILLCQQVEECRVMAIDLSVAMLDLARLNIEVNSLITRIALAHIDSKELLYEDDQFDVVMSNSIVHHVPEPGTVIAEAVRVTKPGGRLFSVICCVPLTIRPSSIWWRPMPPRRMPINVRCLTIRFAPPCHLMKCANWSSHRDSSLNRLPPHPIATGHGTR